VAAWAGAPKEKAAVAAIMQARNRFFILNLYGMDKPDNFLKRRACRHYLMFILLF